jgi:hypothetical protein
VQTDKEATKYGDSDCCAVAEEAADQQETHATVLEIIERQWLRMLHLLQRLTTSSAFLDR